MRKGLIEQLFICMIIIIFFLTRSCDISEFHKAELHFNNKEYEKAIPLLTNEIKSNPENAKAFLLLGQCLLETNDELNSKELEAVDKMFEKSIYLDSDNMKMVGEIYFDRSFEYIKNEDIKKNGELYYNKGMRLDSERKSKYFEEIFNYLLDYSGSSIKSKTTIELYDVINSNSDINSKTTIELFDFINSNTDKYKGNISNISYDISKRMIENGNSVESIKFIDYLLSNDTSFNSKIGELYYLIGEDISVNNPFSNTHKMYKYFGLSIQLNPEEKEKVALVYLELGRKLLDSLRTTSDPEIFFRKSIELNSELSKNVGLILYEKSIDLEKDKNEIPRMIQCAKKSTSYDTDLIEWYNQVLEKYTIQIGNQIWMKENLNITRYNNGDTIHEIKSKESMKERTKKKNSSVRVYCFYEFDSINHKYGKYYHGGIVYQSKYFVPEGWRIPSLDDWRTLIRNLSRYDAAYKVGIKLKSQEGWNDNGNGTNESGFNIFPTDYYNPKKSEIEFGRFARLRTLKPSTVFELEDKKDSWTASGTSRSYDYYQSYVPIRLLMDND